MGSVRTGVLGLAVLWFGLGLGFSRDASALVDDIFTSETQPANTLLMPFDVTDGQETFLLVSNVTGVSPPELTQVSTHWAFWSETCEHLVDVAICLTLNDTVVVDPHAVTALNADNEPIGPQADLSGERGFVTVTAYATDDECSQASQGSAELVDDAIVGSVSIAEVATGATLGADAFGLGVNPSGEFVDLPDALLSTGSGPGRLDIQTLDVSGLDSSSVILMAVAENAGLLPGEIGPIGTDVTANVTFYDNLEVPTSLPDTSIPCTRFASLRSDADSPLIPPNVTIESSGLLRLTNIFAGSSPVGDDDGSNGNDTWVYGVYGQSLADYGAGAHAKYLVDDEIIVEPTPTPTESPEPTPTPQPTATSGVEVPTPTPGGSPSPSPTSSGGPTPVPTTVMPTPSGSATPSGPTPTPGNQPTPGGVTPTPGGVTPTPGGATPTPAPTAPPATPTPGGGGRACSKAIVTVTTSYTSEEAAGVTTEVTYPKQKVTLPGFGGQQSVKDRVTNLSGVSGGVFLIADNDDPGVNPIFNISVGLVSLGSSIPAGNFVRIEFDCEAGASAPTGADFPCEPVVTDLLGLELSATCSAQVSLQQ